MTPRNNSRPVRGWTPRIGHRCSTDGLSPLIWPSTRCFHQRRYLFLCSSVRQSLRNRCCEWPVKRLDTAVMSCVLSDRAQVKYRGLDEGAELADAIEPDWLVDGMEIKWSRGCYACEIRPEVLGRVSRGQFVDRKRVSKTSFYGVERVDAAGCRFHVVCIWVSVLRLLDYSLAFLSPT